MIVKLFSPVVAAVGAYEAVTHPAFLPDHNHDLILRAVVLLMCLLLVLPLGARR